MGDDYAQCLDDAEILKKVTENLDNYFHLLPAKYGKTIFAVALRILGNSQDAEEVTADAFVQAYRSLPHLIEKGQAIHLRFWLVAIVKHGSQNRKRYNERKRRSAPGVSLSTDEGRNLVEDISRGQDSSAEDEAIRHETNEALYRLLRRLPQRQYTIVILYYIGGLSDPEIARILERKPDTIKKDRERALKKLCEMRDKECDQ